MTMTTTFLHWLKKNSFHHHPVSSDHVLLTQVRLTTDQAEVQTTTELPEFSCRFLRRIYYDSTTRVEFTGMTRGQFLMVRGVTPGCPASGFLFAMAFDPIVRCLQDAIIPRNPSSLDFLQPVPCAYADDLAVAAPSSQGLITAMAPAFQTVDRIAGLNWNGRKCCWVQYGSERRESLLHWLSDNCEDFREMQLVKYAMFVGTMIGLDGHIHRWTALRKKSFNVS